MVVRQPPVATVARRAKSFGDFYDAVREFSRVDKKVDNQRYGWSDQDALQENIEIEENRERGMSVKGVGTEIEFYDWYNGVEDSLIEASNEEFVSV